jgi:hypothetical protein
MTRWDADAHMWSGLGSGNNYDWQAGLREICRGIGDVQFQSSMSGYDGWKDVAASAIRRKPKSILVGGHSNGGFATTSIARALEPHGIKVWIISFDRTMKRCPTLGSNVVAAIDIWAGLRKLVKGPNFTGELKLYPFLEETHLSVINNREAIELAIAFGKRWKATL